MTPDPGDPDPGDPGDPRDPRDPRDPGDPGASSRPAIPLQTSMKKSALRRSGAMFF